DAGTVSPGAPGAAAQFHAPSLAAIPNAAAAQAQTLIEGAKGGVPFFEKRQHLTARETHSDASQAAEQLIPLSAFVHDEFGIPQEGVLVQVSFDDGRTERAQTNSMGNFVVMMKKQHESAKVRYTLPSGETFESALREDFFIEMPGTDSDDGLR